MSDQYQGSDRSNAQAPAIKPARLTTANRTAILGAMFLMATSSIGPGFITQTSTFTVKLGAAFAFAIVVSIIVDIAIQLNVWRVIGVSGLRANELGNAVLPGAGWFLAAAVFLGGVVFNIGNVAGTGQGLFNLLGLSPKIGGPLSALLAIGIFLSHRAGVALDRLVVFLGSIMILLMIYVMVVSHPPYGEAARNAVAPESVDFLVITTLIGGTVGGYITFAGAHRLLDSKITGPANVGHVTRVSVMSIIVTGIMRVLLFLAVLGVAAAVSKDSPTIAADAFQAAAGDLGRKLFGIIYWAAGLTSVIGASYTSISFVTTSKTPARTRNIMTVAFIVLASVLFVVLDKAPQKLLIFAGAFNGLILPIAFTIVLWVAWRRRDLLGGYKYPTWLAIVGLIAWLLTIYLGYRSLSGLAALWAS
ncbi:MAG: divalent metal cation transporter [Flaviflexus sp.]|nr:divalent metal cation transporter [Flaviflexus sp.]